jgi:hypothetical protein
MLDMGLCETPLFSQKHPYQQMRHLPFVFLLFAQWCYSQTNYAVSQPVAVKTISQGAAAFSQPIHVMLGYTVSKVSALSSSVSVKIRPEAANALQAQARSQPTPPVTKPADDLPVAGVPSYHALIIAVENYPNTSGLVPLNQPVKDGSKLYLALTGKYNFPKEQTTLLKNPTRTEILQALEDMSKKITPKENIIIFYAGHGVWDERLKVGYWLPSDATINNKANWIANSTLRDYIAGIQAKHTLLITDACFSGSIFKSRDAGITDYAMAKIYQLPSRKAMTSGTLSTVPDESKFMEYLLKRLNENNEKYLTAKQLFFSLETAVLNNTHTVPQYGTIQDTGDEGGDFVFVKKE